MRAAAYFGHALSAWRSSPSSPGLLPPSEPFPAAALPSRAALYMASTSALVVFSMLNPMRTMHLARSTSTPSRFLAASTLSLPPADIGLTASRRAISCTKVGQAVPHSVRPKCECRRPARGPHGAEAKPCKAAGAARGAAAWLTAPPRVPAPTRPAADRPCKAAGRPPPPRVPGPPRQASRAPGRANWQAGRRRPIPLVRDQGPGSGNWSAGAAPMGAKFGACRGAGRPCTTPRPQKNRACASRAGNLHALAAGRVAVG